MTHRGARRWVRPHHTAGVMVALCIVMVGACATRVVPDAFSISLVPTVPVPIRVGTDVGFRLSSTTAGYASLYLIDPVGQVSVLAENVPLAAGGRHAVAGRRAGERRRSGRAVGSEPHVADRVRVRLGRADRQRRVEIVRTF